MAYTFNPFTGNLDYYQAQVAAPTQVRNEVITFSGTTGTLAHTPTSAGITLFRGGIGQLGNSDYVLSGSVITLTISASSGEVFWADYQY